jgi:DNA-binding MarR family transcriptional regulator
MILLSYLTVMPINDSMDIAPSLRAVLIRLARELRREIHSLGVTNGQVSLLVAIDQTPGITATMLAEHERISAAAMSGQLKHLEVAGLIKRERAVDRRRVGVTITRDGTRVLRSVRQKRTAWLTQRLAGLSASEREAIERAIEPLEKLLGAGR